MILRKFSPFLFLLCVFSSCLGDEDFSTSPSDVLHFSVDTLDFDTLISGELAHTRTIQVYNPNRSAVCISSVSLLHGAKSVFRVNIDGTSLEQGSATDFEVRSGDSLRIFVNAFPPLSDADSPVAHTDKLLLQLASGVVQELPLEVHGLDVIKLESHEIVSDDTLYARRPYQILDSLVVREGAVLTIQPGARLFFHKGASLVVYGSLCVNGEVEANVVFRGDRLGNMFTNQSYDCIPGQWGGIHIKHQSFGNHINFADIHSGDYGLLCDSSSTDVEKLCLENSIIHNMSGNVLTLHHVKCRVGNSQLTNAGGDCVSVLGGDVQMVHATIGQFYAFTTGRGVALKFSNVNGDLKYPLERLVIQNSIITGYSNDEIMGNRGDEQLAFNYTFQNCLLNTPKYEAPEVVNCLWDTSDNAVSKADNFFPAFDLDRLTYSFYLDSASVAIGAADPLITQRTYPFDREGLPQPTAPHLGCYTRMLEQ